MGMSRNHVLGVSDPASPNSNPPDSSTQYVLGNEDKPLQLYCAVGCLNSEGGLDERVASLRTLKTRPLWV